MSRIQKTSRFEVLGRGGFKGADEQEVNASKDGRFRYANIPQAREGPVQFEKDVGDDPFNVAELISEVEKGSGTKRYGIQEDDSRASKRARHDESD
jgi:SNW domain-containing protein 1